MGAIIVILYLIVLGLLIWLDWYIAKQFEEAAQRKGHTQKKYFWLCFLLVRILSVRDKYWCAYDPCSEYADCCDAAYNGKKKQTEGTSKVSMYVSKKKY